MFLLSANFGTRVAEIATLKIEAPDRVQLTGGVTVPEALEAMKANRASLDSMRYDLECYDHSGPKFLHPFSGDLTLNAYN